jgi:hypothetical protein
MSAIWESANWTRQFGIRQTGNRQFGMLPYKQMKSSQSIRAQTQKDIRWIRPADNHDFCQDEGCQEIISKHMLCRQTGNRQFGMLPFHS